MKIAIYSPYLDTLGGGEKYMMTIAEILSQTCCVEVLLDSHLKNLGGDYLKKELSERFDLDLDKVSFVKAPIGKGSNMLSRLFFLKKYDSLFYLTDGSIFYPTSKRNILHIQSPLLGEPAKSIWGKVKLKGWDMIIYNSKFTKEHAQNNWPIKSEIVYPPVDVDKIKSLKKKKYILSVGRFFGYLKDKKHEVLIKAFKQLCRDSRLKEWSLHLVGAAGEGDRDYLDSLKDLAKGAAINFYPNLSYNKLIELYGESSIYWHAAGFGEDDPTKMEHFGIATVEAMAGGCVPVVIGKGGQREIVENGKSGFLWSTIEELIGYTKMLISDSKLCNNLSINAILVSKKFSKSYFQKNIKKLLYEINK